MQTPPPTDTTPLSDFARAQGTGGYAPEWLVPVAVKFNLIDKVEHLSAERFVGVKYVSLAEEYLADHFPTFPVLPGVMMLEAVTQAAGWLLHHRTGFARSVAVLKEARNVKYGNFVAPGEALRVEVELIKETEAGASFKATGSVVQSTGATTQAVQARVEIAYFNLADKQPELAETDRRLIEHHRRRWALLRAQNADIGTLKDEPVGSALADAASSIPTGRVR